jgi:sugar/nucleoside kinase (ribokinase family)
MALPHVLTVGDALIDAFLTIHDSNSEVHVDEQSRDFCVRFGDKIDVDRCDFCVGGNAANVAVGLARLGVHTGLVAEIGDDELSSKITNTLEKENIDRTFVTQKPNMPTSFTVGMNFMGDRTLFVQHIKREHEYPFEKMGDTKLFFLTSMGKEWKTPYQNLLEYLKKSSALLAFNPGSLQLADRSELIYQLVGRSDFLFVNKEEAETLVFGSVQKEHNNTQLYIEVLMQQLQKMGPKIVVVTNGGHGSYARDEKGENYSLGIDRVKVVERTGAGDSYTSGFLAAYISGHSVVQAMEWGVKNSAAVVGAIGSQAGLLTKAQMEEKVGKIASPSTLSQAAI